MKRILSIALALLATIAVSAQNGTLDPTNPPEPAVKYRLTVSAEPVGSATTSGSGQYEEGTKVTVKATAKTNYKFKHWKVDGVQISQTKTSFTVTMPANDVSYVAVYEYVEPQDQEYNPTNPAEPQVTEEKYALYLKADPAGSCTFNRTSGTKEKEGTKLTVKATPATGYVFQGWYDELNTLLSSTASFSYTMPGEATTLTARMVYSPGNPGEPSGSQDGVDNDIMPGDVNGDDQLTDTDREMMVQYLMGNEPMGFNCVAADYDGNGQVDLGDAVAIALACQGLTPTVGIAPTSDAPTMTVNNNEMQVGSRQNLMINYDSGSATGTCVAFMFRLMLPDGITLDDEGQAAANGTLIAMADGQQGLTTECSTLLLKVRASARLQPGTYSGSLNALTLCLLDDDSKVTTIALSDVPFSVTVLPWQQTLSLREGWNWVSTCAQDPQPVTLLTEGCSRIQGQTDELIQDPILNMTGNMTTLQPGRCYKVLARYAHVVTISGQPLDTTADPIALRKGWNWVGSIVMEEMPINQALASYQAEEGEQLVGCNGEAVYSSGQWSGSLTTIRPGEGYLLRSASDKPLTRR